MCAIAGIIDLISNEQVRCRMLDTMARRGPDEQGVYVRDGCTLLHSRLTVIDPDGGKQPMGVQWNGEEYVMVYNGELYNTDELRTELEKLGHSFSGHSDTEVVLHAYAQWGEDCLRKFNGIFAFAIWETGENRVFLARDRIGVKPLFFMRKGKGLLFASELKTVLAHPQANAILDREGVAELLLLGPGRTPGCGVLKGMEELEPGCCAYFSAGKLTVKRYWKLLDREHEEDFEQTAEHVRFLLKDAIRRQMISDFPIGCFLSGGLDSSLISSVCSLEMEKKGQRLETFSVDYADQEKYFIPGKFQPNSDTHYIEQMSRSIANRHHWTVLTPEELVAELENATLARDFPGMADVDFSLLAFCRDIRKEVKVALSGECADEIFGGYPWYRDPEIRAQAGFPWAQSTARRTALLKPGILGNLYPDSYVMERYLQTCRESDILPGTDPEERRMKEMMNLNFRWFMQTLLDRKDRMSMYSGLEVRVPFCDYRIAEYLYGVPWAFKDYRGMEKGLLRHAMRGYLPAEILWRKKSPYPKTHDPKFWHLVRERMDVLLETEAPVFELVDRCAVRELMESESPWPWYGQLMKTPQTVAFLLQLDYWLRHYQVELDL